MGMRSPPQCWKIGHYYSGKNLNICINYTATFTFQWGSVYFAINGKSSAETILLSFFASDGKVDTAFKRTGVIW